MRHLPPAAILLGIFSVTASMVFSPAKNDLAVFGTAGDVRITGIDPNTGIRSFSLSFKEAAPVPGQTDSSLMQLKSVTIRSYAGAKQVLEISAPECRYKKDSKAAAGDKSVKAAAELVELAGDEWSWESLPDADIIRITKNVRVTFKSTAPNRAPAFVNSERLDARIPKNRSLGNAERAKLVFSENVGVRMKDTSGNNVSLDCDKLTVLANANSGEIEKLSPAKTSGEDPQSEEALHALDNVVAAGNVRIVSQGREILGDNAEFVKKTETFTVRDNARFEDRKQRLNVTGKRITHILASKKVEVFADDAPGAAPEPVTLTVPSFANKKTKRTGDKLAVITGDKLAVAMLADKNRIDFEGSARVADVDFDLRADKIFVESAHESSLFPADVDRLARVNLIVAENNVRLVYGGNNIRCEHVEITPRTNTVELTGRPAADNIKAGASLAGFAMTIDTEDRTLRVRSEPKTGNDTRQRVIVMLPPLKTIAEQRRENNPAPFSKTTVMSDELFVSESDDDIAYFNFQGNVILAGAGISGTCDKLNVTADSKKPATRAGAARQSAPDSPDASQIRRIIALGHVRFVTDKCTVEGGNAEIFPRAVFQENSVAADNGMDGREPQLITLRRDPAQPEMRPRLTLRGTSLSDITPFDAGATEKKPAGIGALTIESDYQELFNGTERARFFLSGNVVITGKELRGTCDKVEGETLQPLKKENSASLDVTRIIGRGNVRFDMRGNIATGNKVEMLPQEKKIYLTGSPKVTTAEGVVADPGKRITYDWETRNWSMERAPDDTLAPEQIERPVITIPLRTKTAPNPKKFKSK